MGKYFESVNANSSSRGIKPLFTAKRQRHTKKFHDELSRDNRLTDQNMLLKLMYFTNIDVAINQLDWCFEGQWQTADFFKFLFSNTMLKLSDTALENEAQKLQLFYSNDLGEDFVSEVRLLRREFCSEIFKCESVKGILGLILSCDILPSMRELGRACILFCTLSVTVASAKRNFSKSYFCSSN